jgi:hypothetical protein
LRLAELATGDCGAIAECDPQEFNLRSVLFYQVFCAAIDEKAIVVCSVPSAQPRKLATNGRRLCSAQFHLAESASSDGSAF